MHHRRLLIVDDFDAMRDLLTEVFEAAGYEVHTAANGWQAVDAVARASFDLILLLDLDVPLLGGRELAQALRQRLVRMPVVALAGNPTGPAPMGDLPLTAVIGKPIPLATLLALVGDVIQGTDKPTPDAEHERPA